VRALIENAQYMPARGRTKVYLIDEVHMLSKSAFNALLKTLEEPPATSSSCSPPPTRRSCR
jgi:DNA polymerase-3 subunit gamma/tau